MAGLLDFLGGVGEGVAGGLEKQQEQRRKLQQIYAEAQAKQSAAASDPMTQLILKQLGIGTTAGQPAPQANVGQGATPQPEPTPTSLNEYVTQRAAKRSTQKPELIPGFSLGKGGASLNLKPGTIRPIPETQLTSLTNLQNSARGLEFMLQEAEKYRDQLGPLNPVLKRNAISNVIRQYGGQQGLDAFLRLYQDSELAYRQSREGLRFIQGGQSIAQAAYPDPRNQTFDNFIDTARKYLARAAVSHADVLDTLHQSGMDVGRIQPLTSPYLEGIDPGEFVSGLKLAVGKVTTTKSGLRYSIER